MQSRLRTLSRQKETTGILLGVSDNGRTRVTGFKRVAPHFLRQAAAEAGAEFTGYYRLQSTAVLTLRPEDKELLEPGETRRLFLVIRPGDDQTPAEATAWILDTDNRQTVEFLALEEEDRQPPAVPPIEITPRAPEYPEVRRPRYTPLRIAALSAVPLTILAAAYLLWPKTPEPAIQLDLRARNGELTAVWEQENAPKGKPDSVTLLIRDGDKEQTVDLTRNFSNQGNVVLHPNSRDIIMTITVRYPGLAPYSRSATYLGFTPPPPPEVNSEPAPGTKKTGSRKRARSRQVRAAASELNAQP